MVILTWTFKDINPQIVFAIYTLELIATSPRYNALTYLSPEQDGASLADANNLFSAGRKTNIYILIEFLAISFYGGIVDIISA